MKTYILWSMFAGHNLLTYRMTQKKKTKKINFSHLFTTVCLCNTFYPKWNLHENFNINSIQNNKREVVGGKCFPKPRCTFTPYTHPPIFTTHLIWEIFRFSRIYTQKYPQTIRVVFMCVLVVLLYSLASNTWGSHKIRVLRCEKIFYVQPPHLPWKTN